MNAAERRVMEQALEAMLNFPDDISDAMFESITALKAALAQEQAEPVQEPVAWIQPDHLQKARVAPFLCRVEPTQRCADFVPFWTTPPQRPPLTDEEMLDIIDDAFEGSSLLEVARAIERKVRGETE